MKYSENMLQNNLLLNLPSQARKAFLNNCESVEVTSGQLIANKGDVISYAYFPTGCIIAIGTSIEENLKLGLGLVGHQGMAGAALILGVNRSLFHMRVQSSGSAVRISAKQLALALKGSDKLKLFFNGYIYKLIENLAQTAACNRYHLTENRLATLIMRLSDLSQSTTFFITQESLAKMLGIRRVSVTKAAVSLQRQHIISYSRGHLTVLNSTDLKHQCCSCYPTLS